MESRYQGDPLGEEGVYEAPDVEAVPPELAGMEAFGPGPGPEEFESEPLPSLDVTWSVLDTEPGMDDIAEKAGPEFLTKISEGLTV